MAGNVDNRRSAVNVRAADERAIGPLITFLRDHDVELRRTAAVALGQFEDVRVLEALSETLAHDWDAQVRRHAAEGLGHVGSVSVVPILIKALADRSGVVRDAAAEALGRVGSVAAPVLLQTLQQSHSLTIRHGAVTALGKSADARAIAPLIEVLRSPEYFVLRRAAVAALGEMAARCPVPELRNALPLIRRVIEPANDVYPCTGESANEMCRRVIREIEAATAAVRDLPIPAAQPALNAAHLPVPAQPPSLHAERLPIPAASPADLPRPGTWRNRLRKFLARHRPINQNHDTMD